jgi:hypothetical protein
VPADQQNRINSVFFIAGISQCRTKRFNGILITKGSPKIRNYGSMRKRVDLAQNKLPLVIAGVIF